MSTPCLCGQVALSDRPGDALSLFCVVKRPAGSTPQSVLPQEWVCILHAANPEASWAPGGNEKRGRHVLHTTVFLYFHCRNRPSHAPCNRKGAHTVPRYGRPGKQIWPGMSSFPSLRRKKHDMLFRIVPPSSVFSSPPRRSPLPIKHVNPSFAPPSPPLIAPQPRVETA